MLVEQAVETESAEQAHRRQRRNLVLGIIDGIGLGFSQSLTNPALVLTWFVSQLTSSPVLIGLLMPISRGGMLLPTVLLSHRVQRVPSKLWLFRYILATRVTFWSALTLSIFLVGNRNPPLLLGLFFLFYALYSLASGFSGLCFMEITARVIPRNLWGTFVGVRMAGGGLLGLLSAALVKSLLDESRGIAFPYNFGWLLALGGLSFAAGSVCLASVREAPELARASQTSVTDKRSMWDIARTDHNFVCYLLMRVLLLATNSALPFYSLYAKQNLGAPASMAGTYVAAHTAASLIANLVYGRWCDRRGARWPLMLNSALAVFAPLAILSMGSMFNPQSFALVFPLLGITQGGVEVLGTSFTLSSAPANQRVLYTALSNALFGVTSIALMASGLLVQRLGINAMFVLAAACAAASLLLGLRLREPRQKDGTPV